MRKPGVFGFRSNSLAVLLVFIFSGPVLAVDISNPLNLMFVADLHDKLIDVIDLKSNEVIYRIDTDYKVDGLFVTPYASSLYFTNIERKVLVSYDLSSKTVAFEIPLTVVPRHLVPDASRTRFALSDSIDGGLLVISAATGRITFGDRKFPATADVLFDANGIDLYFSNSEAGYLGILDMQTSTIKKVKLGDSDSRFSPPSRSLDGRNIYVADTLSGDVYTLNAYSQVVYKVFNIGAAPARPYTSPEGLFLYLIDLASGRFVAVEQSGFTEQFDIQLGTEVDLVAVGRFDRMNLMLSTRNRKYFIYDNLRKKSVATGELNGLPIGVQGSIDGRRAFVAFSDSPEVAVVDLEKQQISYIKATNNGSGVYVVAATNNVCH